jgi:hypothetical protein
MSDDATTERTVTLATGEEVRLPLSTTATMVGALFPAAIDAAAPLVPDSLRPVRLTPARTAVLLLSVEYQRIDRNQLAPYREVGIFLPVVPDDGTATPLAALGRGLGGYTWQLPVTTEPARALGEVWQFPKTVGSVTFDDDGGRRQTTLTVGEQRVLELTVDRPRTFPVRLSTRSYTDGDGTVRRVPVHIDGRGGLALGNGRVDLGTHPWADQLRVLGVEHTGLGSFSFEGYFTIDPPERLE